MKPCLSNILEHIRMRTTAENIGVRAEVVREKFKVPDSTFRRYVDRIRKEIGDIDVIENPEDKRKLVFCRNLLFLNDHSDISGNRARSGEDIFSSSKESHTGGRSVDLEPLEEKESRSITKVISEVSPSNFQNATSKDGVSSPQNEVLYSNKKSPVVFGKDLILLQDSKHATAQPSYPFPSEASRLINPKKLEKDDPVFSGRFVNPKDPNNEDDVLDLNKKGKPKVHQFERKSSIREAEQNKHIHYYGYSVEERDFEFAKTLNEVFFSTFCTDSPWVADIRHGEEEFSTAERYKFYRRARVCADILGADYEHYIKAQVDRFQNKPVKFTHGKSKKPCSIEFPRPKYLASDLCVETYYEWRTRNFHLTGVPLSKPHRDPELDRLNFNVANPTEKQLDYWKRVMNLVRAHAEANKKSVPESMSSFIMRGALPREFAESVHSGYPGYVYET